MYPSERNFEKCSIGFFKNERPGFPTSTTAQKWVQRCNFVFEVVGKVKSIETLQFGAQDEHSGWIVKTGMGDSSDKCYVYIKNELAASNSSLRKIFLKSLFGSVCRLSSDDFWKFVDQDLKKNRIRTCYVSSKCGKMQLPSSNECVWIFPGLTMSSNGRAVLQEEIFVNMSSLSSRQNGDRVMLPAHFPKPRERRPGMTKQLLRLGKCVSEFYGPRTPHAVHVLSSTLKAMNRDALLEHENQQSIMNVSGDANIGKTLACAIALQMMGAPGLMLSRCTSSAMLDYADVFRGMLVVWDDPRDATSSQLCSIVHEAFHGHSITSLSKGNRSYNASLIIGTQTRLLGIPEVQASMPTFSRLSHVDMNHPPCTHMSSREAEHKLKACLSEDGINSFGLLAEERYDGTAINQLHDRLLKDPRSQKIIPRSVRNLAVDWYYSLRMAHLLGLDPGQMNEYFCEHQINYLCAHNSIVDTFVIFCQYIKALLAVAPPPSLIFKERVLIESEGQHECIAFYAKDFFPWLHKHIPESQSCRASDVSHEIKTSKGKYGFVGKNVSFKTREGSIVRRAVVIKRDWLE